MVTFSNTMAGYLNDIAIPLRISAIDTKGFPHVVSLWFVIKDDQLICATSKFARVVGWLEENPNCGFEIAADDPPYCGIRGTGIAKIVEDPNKDMLMQIFEKYCRNTKNQFANYLFSPGRKEVSIVINPTTLTKWNFSKRMEGGEYHKKINVCP